MKILLSVYEGNGDSIIFLRLSSQPVCILFCHAGPLQRVDCTALPPFCHMKMMALSLVSYAITLQANLSTFSPFHPFCAECQAVEWGLICDVCGLLVEVMIALFLFQEHSRYISHCVHNFSCRFGGFSLHYVQL